MKKIILALFLLNLCNSNLISQPAISVGTPYDFVKSGYKNQYRYYCNNGNQIVAEKMDENILAKIKTPIGIAINSQTPQEIAVSIAAEIIAVKNNYQ